MPRPVGGRVVADAILGCPVGEHPVFFGIEPLDVALAEIILLNKEISGGRGPPGGRRWQPAIVVIVPPVVLIIKVGDEDVKVGPVLACLKVEGGEAALSAGQVAALLPGTESDVDISDVTSIGLNH